MKKLHLDVEMLVVESFETIPAEKRERGTVAGNEATNFRQCESQFCPISDDDPTCQISCGQEVSCRYLVCPLVV